MVKFNEFTPTPFKVKQGLAAAAVTRTPRTRMDAVVFIANEHGQYATKSKSGWVIHFPAKRRLLYRLEGQFVPISVTRSNEHG
jgi:hypothetical protein